jgi:DNA-binding response OmpR family regulator/HPt (histidine-containing phosphotransfer) domain-containing protein
MKKILIIEDDPIVAHIYKGRIEKEGFEVEVANDGQSGFYRIHEFHPDAVLLDLMLPKMNGVEILKKIRAQGQFCKTPIIVFTNAYVPNMIHESFGAGATQVFNKATISPRQILDALHLAIQSSDANSAPPEGPSPEEPVPDSTLDTRHSDTPHSDDPDTEPSFHSPGSGRGGASVPVSQAGRQSDTTLLTAAGASPEGHQSRDVEFQTEVVDSFIQTATENLTGLRKALQEFTKAQNETTRSAPLLDLYRKVHALTGSAGIAGLHNISQMAAALEVLLKELYEKPKNVNASTLRTVAHSVDFIGELFNTAAATGSPEDRDTLSSREVNILVVDDEILSRRAITYALEKANLKSCSFEQPADALNAAIENEFDLILLDVQMPGMDGFELCTKIRSLPTNKSTPVIFVTSLTDFKSRARSSLSGGTDLIAKPFMFIELSVKALTYVLRGRLARR